MTRRSDDTITLSEAFGLPDAVSLVFAAGLFGMSRSTAYRRVRRGEFPCAVEKVGRRYMVTMNALLRGLGIQDVRIRPDDMERGATHARQE
ncbi:helix-turn-helix transcriptional regulator [Streptomyces sp. NPDC090442]|uniref:helix-turn-helix transcriptional regulator n=1 Tax=Streptomyces sp. NPDC090442 TaxID=3365962 RepID=UPI003811E5A7